MRFSLKLAVCWPEDAERREIHYDINNVEKLRGTNANISQNLAKSLIACHCTSFLSAVPKLLIVSNIKRQTSI
jgi:hypothetical protein